MTESEKYEQSIRVTKIATKEEAKRLRCNVGEKYSFIPEPNNKDELFERFEKLHAQGRFEALQILFVEKYGEGNEKIIKDELAVLNKFIDEANQLPTNETFKNRDNSRLSEYSRLANDYYKNSKLPFYPSFYSYFNSNAVEVYANFFCTRIG